MADIAQYGSAFLGGMVGGCGVSLAWRWRFRMRGCVVHGCLRSVVPLCPVHYAMSAHALAEVPGSESGDNRQGG